MAKCPSIKTTKIGRRGEAAAARQPRLKPMTSYMVEQGLLAGSLLASQLMFSTIVHAGPEGGVVVSGQGSMTRESSLHTHIGQESQNLLMDFKSFDLSAQESVRISQPNVSSWFVGNIVGGKATSIFGSITANGKVALINPRGVVFGETASIDAAGIFASALDVNTDDLFAGGDVDFRALEGEGGFVINQGVIEASIGGSVSLLGETVTNEGVIVATLGQVNLASGSRAVVSFGPEQLIGVEVTEAVLENNEGLRAAVSNTGTIDAAGGRVMLTGEVSKSLFDHAVNNEGIIKAKSADYQDGVIRLSGSGSGVINTGTLDASSDGEGVKGGRVEMVSDNETVIAGDGLISATSATDQGGAIKLEGEQVRVSDNALADASGAKGGGTITLQAQSRATVDQGTGLRADSTGEGNGGNISIAADETRFSGEASAPGGPDGGDGGSVDITGREILQFDGRVDTGAPEGDQGTLTLNSPRVAIDDKEGDTPSVAVAALEGSLANIEVNASEQVIVKDLEGDLLELGQNSLSINVSGNAPGALETDAIGFTMAGADDLIRTDGLVTVQITDGSINANALIDIAGTIETAPDVPAPLPNDPMNPANDIALVANNGRIRVRSTGSLNASAGDVDTEGGSILITANGFDGENESGTVWFGGEANVISEKGIGGTVKLLGDRVALIDEAGIDAAGALGGGEILAGGNFQGKGPEPNALRTYVGEAVTLSVDAVEQGHGGTVIVWADEVTGYYGDITARGGAQSGDGGFVEVSGKAGLDFNGTADTGADNGIVGTLLLDPDTVTIDSTGTNDIQLDDQQILSGDGTGTFSISASKVVSELDTSDVQIQATTSINVTVDVDASTNTNTNNLSLEAPTIGLDGLITLKSGATLSGTATTVNVGATGSVQNGIDVASSTSSSTVNVAIGTFTEDLVITKDNLELAGAGTGNTTIQGVAKQTGFPDTTNSTNVEIDANGVSLHDITFQSPVADGDLNEYSSGVVLTGENIEIYNNVFEIRQSGSGAGNFNGNTSVAIQTRSGVVDASSDIDGLHIHDNSFQFSGTGNGYYGIYINAQGTAIDGANVVIENNMLSGRIWRGITTERSSVTIQDNTITTDTANTEGDNSGIRVINFGNDSVDSVLIRRNTIESDGTAGNGFGFAIGLGGDTTSELFSNIAISQNVLTGDNEIGVDVNSSAGGLTVTNNDLSGFDSAGSAITNDGGAVLDASNNWWGVTAGSGIDSIVGGANGVDFGPFLESGTDTDGVTNGFQGDFSTLTVTTSGSQTGSTGRVQEGIDSVDTAGTVSVESGIYTEDLTITSSLTLQGAGSGSTKIKGLVSDSQSNFPAYQNATNILIDASDVTIDGFTLETPDVNAGDYSALITLIGENITITNNSLVSIQGDAAPTGPNDSKTNILIQSIAGANDPTGSINGLNVSGNSFDSGVGGGGKGYYGIYLNQQGAAVGTLAGDEVTIDNNQFNGNIWRAISTERSNVDITNNTIAPSAETLVDWGGSAIALRNFDATTIDDVLVSGNVIDTSSGAFADEILLGFAAGDPFTDIAITSNTGDVSVVGDVTEVTTAISWDTTGDIAVTGNLTSGGSAISLNASGIISFGAGSVVDTVGNALTLTADDLLIDPTAIVDTNDVSDGLITINDADGTGINLTGTGGDTAGNLNLSNAEVDTFDTGLAGLTLVTVGPVVVGDVTAAATAGIGGTTTLDAGTGMDFTAAATFDNALDAQAGGSLNVTGTLATNNAQIDLTGTDATVSGTGSVNAGTAAANITATGTSVDLQAGSTITSEAPTVTAQTDVTIAGTVEDADGAGDSGAGAINFGQGGAGGTADISAATLNISSGTITGGSGNDTLLGSNAGESYAITGVDSGTFSSGAVTFSLIENLTGGTGSDTFDLNGGTLTGAIDGSGGINSVTLDDVANTVTVTGTDTGTATGIGGTFSSIANITGGSGDDTFVMADGSSISGTLDGAGHATADELDLSQQSANQSVDLNAGTATSVIAFVNMETITNNGGSFTNANNVTVDGVDSGTADGFNFSGVANITGTTGTDSFTLTDTGWLTGATGFDGNGGTDTLTGGNAGDVFSITGADTGSVTNGTGTTGFADVDNLTGGTGADTFNIASGATLSGAIAGGTGTDTLTQADSANTFGITGTDSGTVTDVTGGFSNIQNLTGGTGNDAFVFDDNATLTGSIDAAGGVDTLNLSAIGAAIDITAAATSTNDGVAGSVTSTNVTVGGGFDNINTMTGSGVAGSTLTGSTGNDTFATSGTDAGTITVASRNATYSNFTDLAGGSGTDTFNIGHDVTGSIDGDAGTDTVNITAAHNAGASFKVAAEIVDDTGTNTITTTSVLLDGVTSVGQSDRIDIEADNLTITNGSGDVFLSELDSIEVTNVVTGTGVFDLTADAVTLTGAISANSLNLDATGGVGALDQSGGSLTVAGAATLAAQTGDNITLAQNNDFSSVSVTSANDVILVDINSISLSDSTTSGLYDITADAIALTGVISANTLNLDATGGAGAIDQSGGSLTVAGAATLAAQTGDNITLAQNNDFNSVSVGSANNITLVDTNDITLGASTLGGLLDVSANSILVNGALNVGSLDLGTTSTGTMTVDSTITTTVGGMLFDTAALLDINADLTSAAGMLATNVTGVEIAPTLLTAQSGDIDFGAGVGSITVGGLGTVTLDAVGDGSILLADISDAGDGQVTGLLINAEGDVTLASVNLDDTASDGALTINFDVDSDESRSLDVSGTLTNLAVLNVTGTSSNDSATFNGNISSGGSVTFSNLDTVELVADVDISGSAIDTTSVTTLDLSGSASNVMTSTAGNIALGDISSATSELELNAAGQIATGAYSGGGDILVVDSTGATFAGTVTAGRVQISDTTGVVAFENTTSIGQLVTTTRGYGISFTGPSTTIQSNVGFNNSGNLILGDGSSDEVLFNGGATATAGMVEVFGHVKTSNDILILGDVDILGASTIDTTNDAVSAGSDLNIGSIASTNAAPLILDSGAGRITVSGIVNELSNLTILNSSGTTFQGAVGQSVPFNLVIETTTPGETIAFQTDAAFNSITTQNTDGYNLSFTGATTQVTDAVNFTNNGNVVLGNASGDELLFTDGITYSGSGTTQLFGRLRTAGAPADLGGNVHLGNGTSNIDTTNSSSNPGGANIDLGVVNGANSTLEIDAGTGGNVVTFSGNTQLQSLVTFSKDYRVSFVGNDNSISTAVNFLNIGDLTFGDQTSDAIEFTGGVSVSSNANIAGTVSTVGSPLNLLAVTIVDGTTATLETGGGNVDVAGPITGTVNVTDAGSETLTVDAGAGNVTLGSVDGAVGGLTDVIMVSAADTTFGQITLPGSLTQSNAATGNTVFTGTVSLNNAVLNGVNFDVQQGMDATGSVNVTNSGLFTLSGNTAINAANGFTTTGDVNLAANLATGNANIDIGGNLTLADEQNIEIGTGGGDFAVNGTTEGTALNNPETLTLDAGTGTVTFGPIFGANGGPDPTGLVDVTVVNSGTISFDEIEIAGSLTQTNAANGNTVFNNTVSLDVANLFGTNIIFSDFGATGNLSVDATGSIFQTTGTRLTVGGLLQMAANDVTLTDLAASGGVDLDVTQDVILTNNQDLALSGTVGGDLAATANGALTIRPGESLSVTGNSTFVGDSLLMNDLFATGTIALDINQDATVTNAEAANLEGSVGGNLSVATVSGAITDDGQLAVTGLGTFETQDGSDITLNNTANTFGAVNLTGGTITLNEADGTEFDNVLATSLSITSGGNITERTGAQVTVNGLATLSAGAGNSDITLLENNNEFGSLDLAGALVQVNEADNSLIERVIADTLTVTSTDITVAEAAELAVAGNVELIGDNVVVESDASIKLGSLDIVAATNAVIRSSILPNVVNGVPTNPGGEIAIDSPEVTMGVDGDEISLITQGGNFNISGLDTAGAVELLGRVNIDATNGGDAGGANITIVNDEGGIGTIDASSQATGDVVLELTSGTGNITLGEVGTINPLTALLIDSANNISTQQITTTDSISMDAAGDLTLNGDTIAQTGTLSLTSSGGSIETSGTLTSGGDLEARASQFLLLGSNTTSSNGSVTLRSTNSTIVSDGIIDAGTNADIAAGDTVTLNETVTAGGSVNIGAIGDITLNGTDGLGLSTGAGANIRTTSGDLLFNSDLEIGTDLSAFSVEGEVVQAQNTTISTGGSAILSAETGIKIASIDAADDITLVITQSSATNGDRPLFERVNDPDSGIDLLSNNGSIIFLSPSANVGTADDPFVQRAESAGQGIFYGLQEGEAFSVDTGVSQILPNPPGGFSLTSLVNNEILTLGEDINIALPGDFATNYQNLLSQSSNTTGRVGQTEAAASSRSTAASQREEEEEVAEVDEAAFQNLRNYDENPQGIKLPPDQRFAYDDEGNIYFIVTLPSREQRVPAESFVLYRIDLDLAYDASRDDKKEREYIVRDYRPSLVTLSMGDNPATGG